MASKQKLATSRFKTSVLKVVPFGAIVSEGSTRHHKVADFPKRNLNKVVVSDLFQTKNSQELITVLQDPDVCG